MQPGAFHQHREQGMVAEHGRLRKIEAIRILPWAEHQPRHEKLGDIDQHQRYQDLVGVEAGLEQCRYGRPGRAR
ncbi:hypothetical protein SDC9_179606 [bioreactor metagenome]|uniref:Uncharacterized protein n=1 Tax=bioreactor metagenome TaxID=1076179 RepID=A0A645H0C2_9ZZZZ